jgi:hypothetical protein
MIPHLVPMAGKIECWSLNTPQPQHLSIKPDGFSEFLDHDAYVVIVLYTNHESLLFPSQLLPLKSVVFPIIFSWGHGFCSAEHAPVK